MQCETGIRKNTTVSLRAGVLFPAPFPDRMSQDSSVSLILFRY